MSQPVDTWYADLVATCRDRISEYAEAVQMWERDIGEPVFDVEAERIFLKAVEGLPLDEDECTFEQLETWEQAEHDLINGTNHPE